MRGLADIHLDVRSGDIIVDLPGTSYTVTYHKPAVSPQLLAAYLPGENDPRTELTQAEFLARAGRLANERLVNWIGSFRTIGNDLRGRLRRSAVVRTFGNLVNQPSPDCREYIKDRRLRSREPFPRAQKRLELGPLDVRFGLTIAICEDPHGRFREK
jgi:hypothetical protein